MKAAIHMEELHHPPRAMSIAGCNYDQRSSYRSWSHVAHRSEPSLFEYYAYSSNLAAFRNAPPTNWLEGGNQK
jgi:hypothetical protein